MNDTIADVLRDHADDDVHIERLLTAVHAGVRRRRQRRAVLTGTALIAVTALVGVTGASAVPKTVSPAAGGGAISRPPLVTGRATAAQSPQVLGQDRSLFHLDIAGTTVPDSWSALSWASRSGHEELLIDTESDQSLLVEADHDAKGLTSQRGDTRRLTVHGKPAEASSSPSWYAVRWQAVPGLWAQVGSTADLQTAIDVAARVRLDHVYRCAIPFTMTAPASARLVKCQTTTFVDGSSPAGTIWFRIGTAKPEYQVSSYANQPAVATNDTVGTRAVRVTHHFPRNDDQSEVEIVYPYGDRTGFFWGYYGPDEAALRSAVAGFTPVPADDPATWPSTPF